MRRLIAGATVVGTVIGTFVGLGLGVAQASGGSSVGPINFEPPVYHTGDINGQDGWQKTGPYDVAVDSVSNFPNAADFGFDTQALRASNAVTSGNFGDQTFSPGVEPAGELTGLNHFDASFSIGSTQSAVQPGLTTAVAADDGQGGRMSNLRFEDQNNGIHVFFIQVHQDGPCTPSGCANFVQKDIATLSRNQAHTVSYSITFVPGPKNDVVKVSIDGAVKVTGTTWEDYYRYDPEQSGNGNVVPTTSHLLFRESGTAAPGTAGNGFLFDNVSLASSNSGPTTYCGTTLNGGTYTNITVPAGASCSLIGVTVTNDVNVQKGGSLHMESSSIGHNLKADHPAAIGIQISNTIDNDVNIDGVTGGTVDGFNFICYTSVSHDLTVTNSAANASPWSIGGSDCGNANAIGHNLNVTKNKNAVEVSGNHVTNDMNITGNTGGTTVTDNTVDHDANCGGNTPPTTYSGNTGAHHNTCTP